MGTQLSVMPSAYLTFLRRSALRLGSMLMKKIILVPDDRFASLTMAGL
jgi:hypothetical protein